MWISMRCQIKIKLQAPVLILFQIKHHPVNARFGSWRTQRRQRFIIRFKAKMRQHGPVRLHPVNPVKCLFIMAVRLVRRVTKRLDNPQWHARNMVQNVIAKSDNIR